MLTKDLLNYKIKNGKLIPIFIDTNSAPILNLAESLLSIYNLNKNQSRGALLGNLSSFLNGYKDLKLSKGLNKILIDNSIFISNCNEEILNHRAKIFEYSSKFLKHQTTELDYSDYKENILNHFKEYDHLKGNLYSDLPENDIFTGFKTEFTPVSLLERYNCVLIQSLLLFSNKITIELYSPDPRELRGILRYLKFFRLFTSIERINNYYLLIIDGPVNIFTNSQKYGLQLASFFPVICFLKKWQLKTDIQLKNKTLNLTVSHESNLKSHYRNPSSYIPEEIRLFENYFNEQDVIWKIIKTKDFIDTGNQCLIFPDFTFYNSENNRTVHIELFHRWHYRQLLERLHFLSLNTELNLIIGIDRFIYKNNEIKNIINNSQYLSEKIFLFSDFPGVKTTLDKLKNFIK